MFTHLLALSALAEQHVLTDGMDIDVPYGLVDGRLAVFNPHAAGSLVIRSHTRRYEETARALGEAAAKNAQKLGFEVAAVRPLDMACRGLGWADSVIGGDDAREYIRRLRARHGERRETPLVLFIPDLDVVLGGGRAERAESASTPVSVSGVLDLVREGPDFGVHVVGISPRLWDGRPRADVLGWRRTLMLDITAGFMDTRPRLNAVQYGEDGAEERLVFEKVDTVEAAGL